ncbi:glutaredoxin [Hortaea werneckii]|uniref:Thioredoxin domain-containing protein n=1 Tax=Hortaea werneckii TaxID=91943 RepID=A0A3M7G6G5_HORWE|nr:glutaredoxin [Hortaea werneckii]KAI6985432.1 glutaredoxin [Hortaea werneckii]KAI7139896.1 glutaredoxin [Hortaea werneckii]KAI7166647.1 glutaredoxin [Hortaea werneckii]KAI7196739.1 glutaredoxin [Hortaea werneckii]
MAAQTGTCTLHPIASEGDFDSHAAALPPTCLAVIYFHAPWAEPCKQMSTILSTLAATYPATQPPQITFLSLDAEEVSDVSERYDVTQVPLVVLQKDGQVVEAVTGTDAARVRNAVEKHAGSAASTGAGGLPPAQKVTKPAPSANDPVAPSPQTNGAGAADLSKYTPSATDPTTAPQYSSGEQQAASMSKEELNARLAELVKAAPVMLFMKGTPSAPQCGFSRQTVSMLREKGVRYGFFNILADDEVRQGLKEFSDWPTFPQVYVGGELVGGLDILKEEFENDADFLKDYSVQKQAQTA